MTNPSGIQPVEYFVLVAPKQVEDRTAGGLYIPDQRKDKDQFAQKEGVLLAVSPLAFNFDEWPEDARKPQIGDRVLFSRYQADEVKGADGEPYWLMKDKAIMAVLA